MDMVSGVYQPDIIVTSPRLTELNNYIVKNELFVDYNELFAREDSLIKEEDIFECVKKTFSDKSGRMWGMTDVFWVYTMLMNKKYLLGKTTWTVDDMMDINDALPDGVIMNEHFPKKHSPTILYQPARISHSLSTWKTGSAILTTRRFTGILNS